MSINSGKDFCTECRKTTKYTLSKRNIVKDIKGVEYPFIITVATCNECGSDMNIADLIDLNVKEIDQQYRKYECIISVEEIEKLMRVYNIGKAPLSLALGFGEITITRYLLGQIPSKEYSCIMRRALSSPLFVKEQLMKNKEKIAPPAFAKALTAIEKLEKQFAVSQKMIKVIACVFDELEEVSPLSLQKLLYFIQGMSYALNEKPMFKERCQAWIHGPVYPKVYDMFKDFKYNPIDDDRFVLIENNEVELTNKEIKIIDLVVTTFGEYSGRILEKITHKQDPWTIARTGYAEDSRSHQEISEKEIKRYFSEQNSIYDFSTREGVFRYIAATLS